jgi:hypothetical protein
MSSRPPPARVPTLTEVVAYDMGGPTSADPTAAEPQVESGDATPLDAHLLHAMQSRIASSLEQCLLDALAPTLASLAHTLAAQAQLELSALLRDELAQAVARELARQRGA